MPRLLPKSNCKACGARIPTRDIVAVTIKAQTGETWQQGWCKSCVCESKKKPWVEVE